MSNEKNLPVKVNRVSDIRGLDQEDIAEAFVMKGECRQKRVEYIADLIVQVKWIPGRTHKDLAVIWGITRAAVRQYSSEAYRQFKSKLGEPEELRNALLEKLDFVVTSAMAAKQPFLSKDGVVVYADRPDHKAATQGILGLAELAGLKVRKHEHRVETIVHTKEDLEALIKQGLAEVRTKIIETTGEATNDTRTINLPPRISPTDAGTLAGDADEPERVRSGSPRGQEDRAEAER